jgi:hypothetical protein
MDELRAAVLRMPLRKLPAITAAMLKSKYRIRAALASFPEVELRRIQDPSGDTGCFLITTDATSDVARCVNASLKAEGIRTYPQGISNILMTDWGLHLYYNNVRLVRRTSVSSDFHGIWPRIAAWFRNIVGAHARWRIACLSAAS